jgi:hypothetical protein
MIGRWLCRHGIHHADDGHLVKRNVWVREHVCTRCGAPLPDRTDRWWI